MSQVRVLASTSVPFKPSTVQMPNLALIETKWITVQISHGEVIQGKKKDQPGHEVHMYSVQYASEGQFLRSIVQETVTQAVEYHYCKLGEGLV
jgi:hypothetical protein